MSIQRYILAALLGLFLSTSLAATPAQADGGDVRNKLGTINKLEEEEKTLEHNIGVGLFLMQTEFDLSLSKVLVFNLTMLNALKLREVRIQKAVLSRELLHIRMREFLLRTPLGVAYTLQMIAIFTVLGQPIYANLAFNFDPVLWQASMTLAAYYFMAYLTTPEGRDLVHNLTQAMSYGEYGYDAVYNTQYAE
jgi:hypothetical protein